MNIIEGNIRATGKKFALVVSRFNGFVVESLEVIGQTQLFKLDSFEGSKSL